VIHKAHEEFSLNNWDCAPSQKLTQQAPFVITYKATKHTKNINISEANFSALLNHHATSSLATKLN
jgi:hypothetical protein